MRMRAVAVGMVVVGAMVLLPVAAHASTTAKTKIDVCALLKTTEVGQALGGESSAPERAGNRCSWVVTITLPHGTTQVPVTINVEKYSGPTKKDVQANVKLPGFEKTIGPSLQKARKVAQVMPNQDGILSLAAGLNCFSIPLLRCVGATGLLVDGS